MKRLGLLFAGLLAVLGLSFASANFSDVPSGHWAEEAVNKLAAEGVILGFPDGTFRGNEYVTRYQLALVVYRVLERVQAEIAAGKGGVDQETVTALRNAVQELASELASLGVRVSALEDNVATKDDVAKLKAQIDQVKAALAKRPKAQMGFDKAALRDLEAKVEAAAVAADTARAQAEAVASQVDALKGDLAALATKVGANADSIKALNELAVLLNQDVLDLQDRVAGLEKQVVALKSAQPKGFAKASDLAALTEFVQALSGDLANLNGKVSDLEGKLGDLDQRVGTLENNGFTVSGSLTLDYTAINASGFAGYDTDRLFKSAFSAGDANNSGTDLDDAEGLTSTGGQTTANLMVSFQTKKLSATSQGDGVNTHDQLVQFSFSGSWTNPSSGSTATPSLSVDTVSTTFTVAEGQKLTATFGQSVNGKFSEYYFDNEANSFGHGLVLALQPGFLGAEITAVYGNNNPGGYDYFYGVRAAIKPSDAFSLSGAYLKQDTLPEAVYGVSADASLGPISVMGEYFKDGSTGAAASYYVKADAKLGVLSIGGSYRNIAATVTGANVMSADGVGGTNNSAPFAADQTGFGVNGSATLGVFTLDGYYDSYTLVGTPYVAYGATVTLNAGPFTIEGYYKAAFSSNTPAASVPNSDPNASNYVSAYGGSLEHSGDADNAFIKGLNFTVSYMTNYVSVQTNLNAYGDFSGKLGILNLTVLGGYYADLTASTNTVKYGAKVETDPLAIVLKPSLSGGYVARTSTGGQAETKWFAGVKFDEFLFGPNSTFSANYASYSATGLDLAVGQADNAFDASQSSIYTTTAGAGGTLTGYELSWTYWDLTATFASFVDNGGNFAQAFKLAYGVDF